MNILCVKRCCTHKLRSNSYPLSSLLDRSGRKQLSGDSLWRDRGHRVPIQALPVSNPTGESVGEIIIVSHVGKAESALQCRCQVGIILADKNIIHNVRQSLLSCNAFRRTVLGYRLIVLPVVVDGFRHARRRNSAEECFRVLYTQECTEGPRVGSSVAEVRLVRKRRFSVDRSGVGKLPQQADDDGTARLVVGCIEPVSHVESAIAVWLILGSMSLFSFAEARTSDAFRRSLTVCLPLVKPSLSASTPATPASAQLLNGIALTDAVAQASCSTASYSGANYLWQVGCRLSAVPAYLAHLSHLGRYYRAVTVSSTWDALYTIPYQRVDDLHGAGRHPID
ncbi:hypothetical protein KC329_g124 [Hortaea werneckii]|nr:hypothetical protein KC329_g124 [Hortaea werneckii]